MTEIYLFLLTNKILSAYIICVCLCFILSIHGLLMDIFKTEHTLKNIYFGEYIIMIIGCLMFSIAFSILGIIIWILVYFNIIEIHKK